MYPRLFFALARSGPRVLGAGLLGVMLNAGIASGQTSVIFANNPASAVTNCQDGLRVPAGSSFVAGLFVAPDGTTDPAVFFMVGSPAPFVGPGVFNGGTRAIPGIPAGSAMHCQVRVWDTQFGPTYDAAVAANAYRGSSIIVRINSGFVPVPPVSLTAAGLRGWYLNITPILTGAPVSQAVTEGGTATFTVSATGIGCGPGGYQWRFQETTIAGATQATFVITSVRPTDAGLYSVVVSNTSGAVISPPATLTVAPRAPVLINEWLASNAGIVADPADNDFDDLFELFNAGSSPVDLSGYFLTDNPSDPRKSLIPPGTVIPAGGFLLFWADNEPNQGGFHVNFQLSQAGEALALFSPSGTLVNHVEFGPQTENVSQGRCPDGSSEIYFLPLATPGTANNAACGTSAAPLIAMHPESQQPALGSDVIFQVRAAGGGLAYQWRRNGFKIADATNSFLVISNAQPAQGGAYSVIVANEFGESLGGPATLLPALPVLASSDHLESRARFPGTAARSSNRGAQRDELEPIHAGKPGGSSVWFSWRAPTAGIVRFDTQGSAFDTLLAVYTGQDLSSLRERASDDDRGGDYTSEVNFNADADAEYLIAVDGFAGAEGDFLLNAVFEPTNDRLPVIQTHPKPTRVSAGAEAVMSVVAEGTGLTYQWYFLGRRLPGATHSSLTISNVQAGKIGSYLAEVRNRAGRVVKSVPASLEIGPVDHLICRDKFEELFPITTGRGAFPGGLSGIVLGSPSVSTGSVTQVCYSTEGAGSSLSESAFCSVPQITTWHDLGTPTEPGIFRIDATGTESRPKLAVFDFADFINGVACLNPPIRRADISTSTTLCFEAQAGVPYYLQVNTPSTEEVALTVTFGVKLFLKRDPSDQRVELCWCAPLDNYRVESTNRMMVPFEDHAWIPLSLPVTSDGLLRSIILEAPEPMRFFRLRKIP